MEEGGEVVRNTDDESIKIRTLWTIQRERKIGRVEHEIDIFERVSQTQVESTLFFANERVRSWLAQEGLLVR